MAEAAQDEEEEWAWLPHHLPHRPEDQWSSPASYGDRTPSSLPRGDKIELDTRNHMESSCSSTSSSIHVERFATVMAATKQFLAFEHRSTMEWIEPQILFLKPTTSGIQDLDDVYNAISLLASSNTMDALISDPAIWDAITNNKSWQELTHHCKYKEDLDTNHMDTAFSCHNGGSWIYKIIKNRLPNNLHSLFSYFEGSCLIGSDSDELDRTVKSCILLVAIILILVINRRGSDSLA